jgi:hypothetical protein
MKITIDENTLTITANKREQSRLRRLRRENSAFDTDNFTYAMLENLFTNDCFSWLGAEWTGDLTDAPMLMILGDEEPLPPKNENGDHFCMGIYPTGSETCQPILYRWAFMNYALTSPQRELVEKGIAVFTGGKFNERDGQMSLTLRTHFSALEPANYE